ncbi:MAG: hypothetical protein CMB70_04225 [Euryarchaeota archaeon]|nr:hypothetical protein [Euryarchaeota archaeon]|tara:strand:- start:7349 stop:7807 length:459 start_codon:yes stop_codon:yes gene_type:complete
MAHTLLIGFGTETGNSELLAMDAQKKAGEYDIESKCACLEDVKVDDLRLASHLIIVVSTWGDGEQPDNAQDLYDAVEELDDNALNAVNFAILALGDTAFDLFCEAGIQWDELLEKKGGQRFHDRIDCDTDYDDDAEEWIDTVLEKVASSTGK